MTRFSFYPPDRRGFFEAYAAEFRFDHSEPTPWMPLRQDLRFCKIALLTTAGLRLRGQTPFHVDRVSGTADYREIPVCDLRSEYTFDLPDFPHAEAMKDINVLVPVDAMIAMAERRAIGELDESLVSFVGRCGQIERLRESARAVADRLRARDVDVVVLLTASYLCNQTAGIIARELEKRQLSTVTAVTIKEVAHEMKIPRAVFINFPFGMLFGSAFARPVHEAIVRDMLNALRTLDKPGKVLELPYKWEGPADV